MADATQMSGVLPFGKYLLDAEIARGGMARVFRARLRGLGGFEKVLVVKQILPELAKDPRFVDMFVREANTLVQMNHPNIVPVYELGVIDGVYFLAMEHVEGATLAEIIQHNGALPPELVVHIGIQICDALHYAHDKFGVVHRDVTPRNIIVDASGHVRLLDFGIAAPVEGTATNEIFGSHGYMPKEQIRGDALTAAADVFALGSSLFEAFTAKPAFRRENAAASQAAVLVDEGPFFAAVSQVPRELRDVLDRTLSRDAETRPHVVEELGKKLRTWLSSSHPEGVARALGELADAARTAPKPEKKSSSVQTPTTVDRDPSQVVKTLATSRILDAILSGEAPNSASPAGGTERMPARAPAQLPSEAVPAASDARSERGGRWPFAMLVGAIIAAGGGILMWKGTGSSRDSTSQSRARISVAPTVVESPPVPIAVPVDAGVPDAEIVDAAPLVVRATESSASLSVNAIPWAEVKLDGRALGNTPRRQQTVSAGAHTLELYCPPLDRRVSVQIRVVAGQTVRVVANLATEPPDVTVQ